MIDTQTVLVLGAGASNPYGYPTGAELRKYIWSAFPDVFSDLVNKEHGSPVPDAYKKAKEFADIFRKSNTGSIDLFLARNLNCSEFGKKAIAVSILESEKTTAFPENDRDWYFYLYKRMTEGLIASDSYNLFSGNKIAFLTFNYDRSLECFLEESLTYSFQSANPVEMVKQQEQITIHHIYGCIDRPQWSSGRAYRTDYNLSDVNRLSKNIKIVHEIVEMKSEVQQIIEKAQRIFFLGFGYAKENLQALGIGSVNYVGKRVFGTTLGLTNKEHGEILKYLKLNFRDCHPPVHNTDGEVILEQMDSLQLLKKYL